MLTLFSRGVFFRILFPAVSWHEWCLFILSVCLWLFLQPLGLAFTSGFLPLKSVCPISWPWTGSKMTPPHTHWTSFQMATPAPQETVKQHTFWPTPSQSPLSCCHRLLPLFQTWELCVHHFQRTHCQALQVASFTSLSLKGSPQKPTSPLPAPARPPWEGHWALTAQQQVSPRNNPTNPSPSHDPFCYLSSAWGVQASWIQFIDVSLEI